MRIGDIAKIIEAQLPAGEYNMELEITSACGTDLMSDCLAYVKENVLLLTGLVSPQVIRTAEMMDIKAVAFVRGKKLPDSILDLAREKGIIVLVTNYPMFIACGKLYTAGLTGRGVYSE
ncbi:MAG: hypothetical protein K0R31_1441 [Clostridiales bacterium]|nr:hypothetical protein [Clostridiales bacterium]